MTWTETARAAARNAVAGDIAVHDEAVLPIIRREREAGLSLRKIAETLRKRGIPSPGNRSRETRYRNHWTPAAVLRICRRNGIGRAPGKSDAPPVCTSHALHPARFRADMKQQSPVRSHLSLLTPERWERARQVLHGQNPHGVSTWAAACAAGVSHATLLAWIRRACERRPGDDPLLTTIAQDYEDRRDIQADVLEDALWDRAMNGIEIDVRYRGKRVGTKVRYNDKLALALLKRRNPAYRFDQRDAKGEDETAPAEHLSPEQLYQKMRNAFMVNAAKEECLEEAAAQGLLPPVLKPKAVASEEAEAATEPSSAFIDDDFPTDL